MSARRAPRLASARPGAVVTTVRDTVTVNGVDQETNAVTFTSSRGVRPHRGGAQPEMQAFIRTLRPRQRVNVAFVEATAISVAAGRETLSPLPRRRHGPPARRCGRKSGPADLPLIRMEKSHIAPRGNQPLTNRSLQRHGLWSRHSTHSGAPGRGRVATTDDSRRRCRAAVPTCSGLQLDASGLLLTGIVAYVIANSSALMNLFWQVGYAANGMRVVQPTLLGWAAMLSPLAFVLVLSFGVNRMARSTVQMLFWLFAAAMGASLSNIFLRYTGQSIATTFFVCSAMFAGISLYGYTTKADLTRMGSFMMMGLIGIIIAALVNIFLASSALAFAITSSRGGVLAHRLRHAAHQERLPHLRLCRRHR